MAWTEQDLANQRRRRERRRLKGLCEQCGRQPSREGKTQCSICVSKNGGPLISRYKIFKKRGPKRKPTTPEDLMEIADRLYRLRRMVA